MSIHIENRDPFAQIHIHDGAVYVARKVEGVPKLKIAALIGAGSLQDITPGTAHFFEHLPFNFSSNFKDGEIFKFFTDHGGYVNAFTSYNKTVYYGEVEKSNYIQGIHGIAELICRPVFEANRITDEAKTIVTEWAMCQGTQSIQRRKRLLRATLGSNNPHEVIGTPESIKSIGVEDVSAFYQRYYTTDNLIVYMQGDFDHARLIEEGIKQFSLPRGLRRELPPAYAFQPTTLPVPIPDAAATHVSILFPAQPPHRLDPLSAQTAYTCAQMISSIEGGMYKEARFDKRLVYGIDCNGTPDLMWGLNGIDFDAFPDAVPEVCEIIIRHLTLLASQPDQSLFESIRRNKMAEIADYITNNREQDPQQEIGIIWASTIVQPRDAHLKILPQLTVEDIALYAKKYLANGPASVIYEGKVDPNFPDHEKLEKMRPNISAPPRTQEMNDRLTESNRPSSEFANE